MATHCWWLSFPALQATLEERKLDKFTALKDGSIELVRDMAGTHGDFLRLLPIATEGRTYALNSTEVEITPSQGKRITISLGAQGVRRIGPTVALPITTVRYGFHDMTRQEIDNFLTGFDRYYHRGGG